MGGASIRRRHVPVLLYIMQAEDPALSISVRWSGRVLYNSESRFIFHCLRARVEGNMELRCKFPVHGSLGTFDRNGNCHSYLFKGWNSFTLPSALFCTRRQHEVPATDREDIWKEKTSLVFQKLHHPVILFYYLFFLFYSQMVGTNNAHEKEVAFSCLYLERSRWNR